MQNRPASNYYKNSGNNNAQYSNGEEGHSNGVGNMNNSNYSNQQIMEGQNNERIGALSDQVSALKSLTIDINNEVSEQNRLLNDMDSGFGNIGGLLGSTMNRITTMMDATGSRHMWYLAGKDGGVEGWSEGAERSELPNAVILDKLKAASEASCFRKRCRDKTCYIYYPGQLASLAVACRLMLLYALC